MTGQSERSAEALNLISSAVTSPDARHFRIDVLGRLKTFFTCQAVTMQRVNPDGANIDPESLIIRGVSDTAESDSKFLFFRDAPLARWIQARPRDAVPLSLWKKDALPDKGLNSGTYRLFLMPNNLRHSLVLNMHYQGCLIGMIGLHRSADAGRFIVYDRDFDALLSPLARALERVDASRPHSLFKPAENGARGHLTAREGEVALEVSRGLRNREIAMRFGITENTVEAHMKTIYRKLRIRSRIDLVTRLSNRAPNNSAH